MMTFGENIRNYRTKLGLTQEELGEKIGLSGQAVSKWETNDSLPDTAILPTLAEVLGVSIDMLFGRETVTRSAMAQSVFSYLRGGERDKREERMYEVLQAAAFTFTEEWWEGNVYDNGVPDYYLPDASPHYLSGSPGASLHYLCHHDDTSMGLFSLYRAFPFAVFLREPKDGFASLFTEEAAGYLEAMGDRDVLRCMAELLKRKECLVETAVLLRDAGVDMEKEEEIFEKMKVFHRLLCCRTIEINGTPRRMVEYFFQNDPGSLIPLLAAVACARVATMPIGVTRSGARPTKGALA